MEMATCTLYIDGLKKPRIGTQINNVSTVHKAGRGEEDDEDEQHRASPMILPSGRARRRPEQRE